MAENKPVGLTYEHSVRLAAVIEDARKRACDQLLDGGYAPEVIDLEMAFVFARCAARHGLDVADIGRLNVERLEAMNRALHEELKVARAELESAVDHLQTRKLPDGRTMTVVKKGRARGARIR